MHKDHPLAPNSIVFCERRWKPVAVVFGLLIAFTFLWAFYILTHYLESYDLHDYSINAVDGGMAGMVNVATGMPGMGQQGLVANAVVTVIDNAPQGRSLASGAIVHAEGYILTTAHSVQQVRDIAVVVFSSQGPLKYEARLIKTHRQHDLALLKMVTNDKFRYLKLADTQQLRPGARLTAFGKTLNGAIIAKSGPMARRGLTLNLGNSQLTHLIETDLPFTPAQGGGPMVNDKAELVGINIVVNQPNNGGVAGYTVPAHVIRSHFQDVVSFDPPSPKPVQGQARSSGLGLAAAWWGSAHQQFSPAQPAPQAPSAAQGMSIATVPGSLPQGPPIDHIGKAGDKVTLSDLEHDTGFSLGSFKLDAMFGLAILGVLGGLLGSLMPMGGSILVVTAMMLLFGYGLYLIRPVIYLTNLVTYGIQARHLFNKGLVMRGRVLGLIPWIIFGVILGFFIGHNLHDHLVGYLLGLYALAMAAIALYEVFGPRPAPLAPVVEAAPSNRDEEISQFVERVGLQAERRPDPNKLLLENITMGTPVGLLTGILGIGGGVTEAFYQRRLAGIASANALANTVVMVIVASFTAALVSFFYGSLVGAFAWQTPLTLAMVLIPAIFAGALLGAKFLQNLDPRLKRSLFALVMLFIALAMFFNQ
ncbi:MAG: TSUP family transporter [Gammaproteobacteria bacterium SHHR-1]|uniref:TSUP family transporter n=1 Tax=Magnetovirga frankeli TaxID=947516 RepID=UPI001292D764|nr:TSUP family transporter [gamma proteobacterium SS-5]